VLERADPIVALGNFQLPARFLQFGLAGLMVVVLAVLALGGGSQRTPATAAVPSATPNRTAVAATPRAATSTKPKPTAATVAGASTTDSPTTQPTVAPETSDPTDEASADPAGPTATAGPAATAKPTKTPSPTTAVAAERTYRVRAGDTLSAIAARFNTTVAVLVRLNNIKDPSRIRVGQIIKLP
jgi:LysM repeat protein